MTEDERERLASYQATADMFAAHAMQALIVAGPQKHDILALDAWRYAAAMMRQRATIIQRTAKRAEAGA